MAPIFRYRFVDPGTAFTGDSSRRDADNAADRPATLYSNELACDVGGTCWGANEPLAILDHPPKHESRCPCASATVLHKANLIREKFAGMDQVWLITHKEPDFDAMCSMYLARWVIEDPAAAADWQRYGLHPEGWHDAPGRRKIDWLDPDLTDTRPEHRWALLLASYAARLEMRRQISCPPERALRSILYAALKRGRDYLSAGSGATEFFDEVKIALREKQLNPAFDSVLGDSAQFAPELEMLDRAAEAYPRDYQRARKAIVYLPEAEAPFADFFEHKAASEHEVDAEHLTLADTFRIPTDGIYLRDPECALFTEWVRVDLENSALGAGFEFTAIAYSNGRPEATANRTRYIFSIDPERANGRHLYTVWSRLETREVEGLRSATLEASSFPRLTDVPEPRGVMMQAVLSDPWLGGQTQSGTVVDTPNRGTLIAPPGVDGDLRDDPVAEAVRSELEDCIYTASSLMEGPQIAVSDFAATHALQNAATQRFHLNARWEIPPPNHGYFRFGRIGLRPDVPIEGGGASRDRLVQQIATTLWQVLYSEQKGARAEDLMERFVVATADSVGVWGDRGVAIAQTRSAENALEGEANYEQNFAAIVSLLRDSDVLIANWSSPDEEREAPDRNLPTSRSTDVVSLKHTLARSEELIRRAAQLQRALALPGHEVLRRFYDSVGIEQLAAKLRDLNSSAGERLRQIAETEQARKSEKRAAETARARSRREWLEVLLLGFIALAVIDLLSVRLSIADDSKALLNWLGGPIVLLAAALAIRPWKAKPGATTESVASPFLIVVGLLWIVLWLARAF